MTRTEIPDDLAAALHTAADAMPAHGGELVAVRARGRTRRRRRTAAAAGGAALAVVAALGVPFVLSGSAGAPPAEPPGLDALLPMVEPGDPAEPAQRLLLDGKGWAVSEDRGGEDLDPPAGAREAYEWYQQQPGAAGVLSSLAEVRPDGDVVDLDLALAGVDGFHRVVDAPAGRLAAIGYVDLAPAVSRADGPCVEGLELRLLIIEPDGSVSLSRDVRVNCETVTLLAADTDHAYLLRNETRLVAHDLATGQERVLLEAPFGDGSGAALPAFGGGRAVQVGQDPADAFCMGDRATGRMSVTVREIATDATTTYPVPGDDCHEWGRQVRLSPDGRHAAIGYESFGDEAEDTQLRVAVMDLDTGAVVADQLVHEQTGADADALLRTSSSVVGMAWDDERTLRVAWYAYPGDGLHWLPDLVEVQSFAIG